MKRNENMIYKRAGIVARLKELKRCADAKLMLEHQKYKEAVEQRQRERALRDPEVMSNSCDLQLKVWELENVRRLETY